MGGALFEDPLHVSPDLLQQLVTIVQASSRRPSSPLSSTFHLSPARASEFLADNTHQPITEYMPLPQHP